MSSRLRSDAAGGWLRQPPFGGKKHTPTGRAPSVKYLMYNASGFMRYFEYFMSIVHNANLYDKCHFFNVKSKFTPILELGDHIWDS
jgi:hypothetical protein